MTTEEASIYPELNELTKLINSLPGIEIFDYEFNKHDRISIWFKSTDRRGIFLLSRATSNRYWESSDNWMISVSCGDQFLNNYLPVYYCLFSLKERSISRKDIPGLIKAINKLMKDKGVLDAYNLGNITR